MSSRAALLLLTALFAARASAAVITSRGTLAITLPADLLRRREVKDHLTSGLTTVFVIATTARDDRNTTRGGARVEVRFALWEEQYVVTVIGPTGEEQTSRFESEAAFARWWTQNPLTVSAPLKYGAEVNVHVKLTMLPFSTRDQRDTRRWVARTLASSDKPGEPTPAQSAEVLRIIVETSVRRRPLFEREWSERAVRE